MKRLPGYKNEKELTLEEKEKFDEIIGRINGEIQ